MKSLFVVLAFVALASATVYFQEDFSGDWQSRWVESTFKGADAGVFDVSAGAFYNDAAKDAGLRTTQDARFYQISAAFPEFDNKDKDLILQFSVKHEQKIDCGGGYFKILPAGLDQEKFNGDSAYNLMFGPDICGSSTRRTHVIFNNKGTNHLINNDVRCESDSLSHLYTLVLHPNNNFEVLIDGAEVKKGSLKDDFSILPPRMIPDPAASKPSDWDDRSEIPDPEDTKPADWDDTPAEIADPEASKPEDWDDELDGEWEAPMIPNPDYQGEWEPDMIPNPAYKGAWVHPQVPNPEFVDDDSLYHYPSNKYIGLEIWQVKSGTIFDNILITDDMKTAQEAITTFQKMQEGEKAMFEKQEAERRAQEEKEREAMEAEAGDAEELEEEYDDKEEL